jgi:hypothetical protein
LPLAVSVGLGVMAWQTLSHRQTAADEGQDPNALPSMLEGHEAGPVNVVALGDLPAFTAADLKDGKVKIGTSAHLEKRMEALQTVSSVSAASFLGAELAPDSIIAAFGVNLATAVVIANTSPLPTMLAGTKVSVKDSAGTERLAPLFFVAPSQVNFLIPPTAQAGDAVIEIIAADGTAKVFKAERPVYSFFEYNGGVIVLLKFEDDKLEEQSRNILYIDEKAKLVWTIEAPEHFQFAGEPFKRPDAYCGARVENGILVGHTYSGNGNEIDPKTGKFVRFLYWSK